MYAVLGRGPANERRAALVDAAWALLDPEGTGFVERASFFEAYDASRHPRVTYLRTREEWERYVESSIRDEERILSKWYERSAGVDRAGHVSRREFQMYYAECSESEDIEDDEAFDAGHGAVLNELGEVELDAIVMDGVSLTPRQGSV